MATKLFLGEPPANIKQWIIDHYSKPKLTELCFTAEQANSSIKLQKQGSATIEGFNGLEYKKVSATQLLAASSDEWKPYTIGSFGQNNELSGLNVGDKVYMRAVAAGNSRMGTGSSNYHKFVMTGKIAASGNINTLLNSDPNADVSLEGKDRCYYRMFYGCSSLTQAPELPATTLASSCYSSMFQNCSSLTQAPELPATTLASNCYYHMFDNCTDLTQAPELPVTTLADNCYSSMFKGCSSLTQALELPATTLASSCYNSMFQGCSSLTQAPELLATTLADHCYSGMFQSCTSLTQAPELPVTTLADYCYQQMFYNCSSLTQAPELPATTLADGCYNSMFFNCPNVIEITFANLTCEYVVANAVNWGLGINANYQKFLVVAYCSDGIIIINDKSGSSS